MYRGAKQLGGSWVPYRTHRFLLPSLMSGDNFITIIASRFFSFAYICIIKNNSNVFFIANNARVSPLTNFSKKLHFLFHIPYNSGHPFGIVLRELLFVKHKCLDVRILHDENIDELIMSISCA